MCLCGLRKVRRVSQRVMRAFEVREVAVEEKTQHLGVLLELILPRACAGELDAVGLVLGLVPTRAETAGDATAREQIDRGERLCEHDRVTVGDAEHEATDTNPCRLERGSGEGRDRFEARFAAAPARRLLEVVRHREPLETALVGETPEAAPLLKRPTK